MAHPLSAAAHLTAQAMRIGWFYGLNRLLEREAGRIGPARPKVVPSRPVPSQRELFADLGSLLLADAAAVRDGLYPAMEDDEQPLDHLARVRSMFTDLPGALRRRHDRDAGTARTMPEAEGLPDYFAQDFHFQTGGYLTEDSARLYDVQVETLFFGAAAPMRRAALKPIARFIAGRDQRRLALCDVACGTGRFLRQVRRAWPALNLTGLDLSRRYLDEAARHLRGLRPAELIAANAEAMPLEDASQDIVTTIFLFHELPPDVRRRVAREMARILRPGGLLVFVDSLQMGDRPAYDGLLEAFPVRFHEPYFRGYALDDLARVFADAGLRPATTTTAFLSKVMTWRKP